MPYVKSYVTFHKNVQHITQNITSNRPNLMDKYILKVSSQTTKETALKKKYIFYIKTCKQVCDTPTIDLLKINSLFDRHDLTV